MNALILVDLQNDFMPGGPLPVPGAREVIPLANRLQRQFEPVLATQDWHPADHASFASNHPGKKPFDVIELDGLEQVLWPDHCVRGTSGAELVPGLERKRIRRVFRKGTDREIDSYSGFYDNGHRKATGLGDYLADRGVSGVVLCGVATDVCVKYTALDARRLGLATRVVEDACRGVELAEGDVRRALEEMARAGVQIVSSGSLGAP